MAPEVQSTILTLPYSSDVADGAMPAEEMEILEEAQPDLPKDVASLRLELVPFLGEGETYVDGSELAKRAKDLKIGFARRLSQFLRQSQGTILKDWRRFCLAFPDLVFKDERGDRRILSLNWKEKEQTWQIGLRWLDRRWGHFTRLVRLVQ